MKDLSSKLLDQEALLMHAQGRPGKLEIHPTKPLTTQHDLTLAYSPGVAAPCLEIARDPSLVYDYTAMGNTVAVITNGTAVLGLGNIGPLASKPVMEGKSVLFKRFADIDGINLELHTEDIDEFVQCVRTMGNSFGGINLEDIKAPECFVIEQQLREMLDIPVFHDDQHGTAIISSAAMINALEMTGRDIKTAKMVVNGAGAAAIACVELLKAMGMQSNNITMCDSKGVIYQGRTEGMNQWKSGHAVKTKSRTLTEALVGADVFLGLSVKDAVTPEMVTSMADQPIIFAMANPDPEITPETVKSVRDDAIIATGRSDYPNQVNNVLGFPYIFRGTLDVRASTINDEMKIAAVHAIAALAREDVPDEVNEVYTGKKLVYGPEYLIPTPFDPRLITQIPKAVAQAAMDSGVARKPIIDMDQYEVELSSRLNPTAGMLETIFKKLRNDPKRVVFAEGEEEKCIRAACAFLNEGLGTPVLVGREERIRQTMDDLGLPWPKGLKITNAKLSPSTAEYTDLIYDKLKRKGFLRRDCERMAKRDRNVFGAAKVASGDADVLLTGLTRNYHAALDQITRVLEPKPNARIFGLSLVMARGQTLFVADTAVHEQPNPEELADFAQQSAAAARNLGHDPRVALISFSNFGHPDLPQAEVVRQAVKVLDDRNVGFEYDGDMDIDVALSRTLMEQRYPFCRLTAPANILIMPGLQSSNISTQLLNNLGRVTVLGPLLLGLHKPVQIVPMGATVSDMVSLAALAAYGVED